MKTIALFCHFVYGTWYGAGVCFALALFVLTFLSVLTGTLGNDSPHCLIRMSESVLLLTVGCFANEILAVALSLTRCRWREMLVQVVVTVGLLILAVLISFFLSFAGLDGSFACHA